LHRSGHITYRYFLAVVVFFVEPTQRGSALSEYGPAPDDFGLEQVLPVDAFLESFAAAHGGADDLPEFADRRSWALQERRDKHKDPGSVHGLLPSRS
jgi:hypothetical protein